MSQAVCVCVNVCMGTHAHVSGICRRGRAGRPPPVVWALLGLRRLTGRYAVWTPCNAISLRRNAHPPLHTHIPSIYLCLPGLRPAYSGCPCLTSISLGVSVQQCLYRSLHIPSMRGTVESMLKLCQLHFFYNYAIKHTVRYNCVITGTLLY